MNSDGTNEVRVLNQPIGRDNDQPTWGSNSRLYFHSYQGGSSVIYGLDAAGSNLVQVTPNNWSDPQDPSVSADGTTILYWAWNGTADLFTISSTGNGTATQLTGTSTGNELNSQYFRSPYPGAPSSNAAIALASPSPSDAPYTRKLNIKLSGSGVARFEYGWSRSTSSTAAPNTNYLQQWTDVANKANAKVNFLGSKSGTSWNGGTEPDQDWYLWIRSVSTAGVTGSWNTNKLKVHTPKRPVWVAVGDSTSSGHNQLTDERACPADEDAPWWYELITAGQAQCDITDAPHVNKQDYTFSWVNGAVIGYNQSRNAPSSWAIEYKNVSISGTPTSKFGVEGQTAGSSTWASGDTQASQMAALLYPRYDSWNVVSMTGGANDSNWAQVLIEWYPRWHNDTRDIKPWAVATRSECPDAESIWNSLQATDANGKTVNERITANLQGVVTAAAVYSPGTRVLNVGVHYAVDSTNVCYPDNGSNHGVKSVVDQLNADHTAITGANVKYVNVAAALGNSPVSANYIQLTRLYGYPHWSGTGQAVVSTAAQSVLNGTW